MEDFVVGAGNRLAHAAALNLVEHPASTTIPLTLHGPSGTGKTHLLEGIHGELCKRLNVGDEQV
jgi:chromosomal replication initiator protein